MFTQIMLLAALLLESYEYDEEKDNNCVTLISCTEFFDDCKIHVIQYDNTRVIVDVSRLVMIDDETSKTETTLFRAMNKQALQDFFANVTRLHVERTCDALLASVKF